MQRKQTHNPLVPGSSPGGATPNPTDHPEFVRCDATTGTFADTFAVIRSRDTPIMRVWVLIETGDTEAIDCS